MARFLESAMDEIRIMVPTLVSTSPLVSRFIEDLNLCSHSHGHNKQAFFLVGISSVLASTKDFTCFVKGKTVFVMAETKTSRLIMIVFINIQSVSDLQCHLVIQHFVKKCNSLNKWRRLLISQRKML